MLKIKCTLFKIPGEVHAATIMLLVNGDTIGAARIMPLDLTFGLAIAADANISLIARLVLDATVLHSAVFFTVAPYNDK